MKTVDEALEERRRRPSGARGILSLFTSLALHAGLVAVALLAPGLFAEEPRPIEYRPVMLVPAPAVGVESPSAPEPAQKTPEPERTPEPEAPKPPADVPVLPDEKPREKTEAPKPPEPKTEPKPAAKAPDRPAADDASKPSEGPPGPQGSPTGDPRSSFTQGAAVLGVEDPSFTYGYYLDRLVVSVRSQWVRPPLGSGVEAVVHFRIREDGSVQNVRIARSSGYNSFDLAALRAVQAAAPLPPLPRSYQKDSLGVNLVFQ